MLANGVPANATRNPWLAAAVVLLAGFAIYAGRREHAPVLAPAEALTAASPAPLQSAFAPQSKSGPPAAGSARRPVAATNNLQLYVSSGSYARPAAAALAPPLEAAVQYVTERTGMRLARPVNVVFDRRAEACGLDAVAYTEARTLIVYTCPDTPGRRATNILAHEVVHQLAQDRYGAPHLQADLILSEGVATWGAGRYWLGRYTSFHDFVQREYGARLLPLATDPRAGVSTDTLNQLYYQWASYVEWISATYGPAALDRLYTSGKGRALGSADYAGILGIPFNESETRWRVWLGY